MEGLRRVLKCPRMVVKARVTLLSLEVRVRNAFPSIPGTNEIIHCFFQKYCAVAILGGQPGLLDPEGDILVAEV